MKKVIPELSMLLLQLYSYSCMASFMARGRQQERLASILIPFCLLGIICAVLYPRFAIWRRHGSIPSDKRLSTRNVIFCCIVAGWVVIYAAGFEAWLHNTTLRHIANFGLSLLIPVTYTVFFNHVQVRWRGVWLGSTFAAGVILFRYLLLWDNSGESGWSVLELVFWTQIVLVVPLVILVLYAELTYRPIPQEQYVPVDESGGNNWLWIFCSAGCLYLMNAFIDIRLFPNLTLEYPGTTALLFYVLVFSCPLAGWYLDRNPVKGFAVLTSGCAVVFITVPCLLSLGDAPALYTIVHAFSVCCQFITFIVMTTILSGLSRTPDTLAILPGIFFSWRVLSIIVFVLLKSMIPLSGSYRILFSTLTAGFFFLFIKKVKFSYAGTANLSSVAATNIDAESYDTGTESHQNTLFNKYNLSPREREVALLLLRGASTREMGASLHISESTVKSHVKNILVKFDVPTRATFLAKILDEHGNIISK